MGMMVGVIGVIALVAVNALFLIWMERKVSAHMQLRPGPMEVGSHGAIQTVADALKLMGKELITPEDVDRRSIWLAPIVVFLPVLLSFLVIPFSQTLIIRDMNVGILLILAFPPWRSWPSSWPAGPPTTSTRCCGAIRSVAQNIAYEIPLLITVMSIILMVGSFKLSDIVAAQGKRLVHPDAAPGLSSCLLPAPPPRPTGPPSTCRKRRSELVAGFHTEYTGMRFALFFLAEYTNMFIAAAVATVLFLGGWHGPILPGWSGSSSRSTPSSF